jgi:signal transduction histidine kinase
MIVNKEASTRPDTGADSTEQVNILLVNDRPAQLLTWQAMLSDLGQNLVLARSGLEALEQLLMLDFAVILLDVKMPTMDGFETAALIRQRPRSETTPILFVTAVHTDERARARGYALGAVDYIFTPVVPEILRAKVGAFVDLFKKTQKVIQQTEQLTLLNQVLEAQLREIRQLNKDLTAANAVLRAETLERKRAEAELRELSARLHSLREEERAYLSREIHDELGGLLTASKMDVIRLRREYPENAEFQSRIQGLLELIDATVQAVRRIATDLRPSLLDDFGLLAALEWQLKEFEQRMGITCHLVTQITEIELNRDCAIALFRVFQESLTNVARHAQATRVEVSVDEQADHLVLRVQDNGRGVSPNDLVNVKSLGLAGMRERVRSLAGELDIQGTPGQGTLVLVKIPLEKNRPALTDLPRAS